jgi:glycerol uptake facilitator-like aquaporin
MVLAAHRNEITERSRRRLASAMLAAAALLVLYWPVWLLDRTLLAADTRPAYYEFQSAFFLADVWLAVCLVAGARALTARRSSALLWLLAAGGAGGSLVALEVLYNLQHGVWFASGRGLTELARNLATGAGTVGLFTWAWPRRAELLAGD